MTDLNALLKALSTNRVDYIIVGGVAATIHGAARLTQDLDIVYDRSSENIARLVRALAPFSPYLRGAPPGLPFLWDTETIRRGLNFTLTTSIGDVDIFGELIGGGAYHDLRASSIEIKLLGASCLCLGLEKLIQVKRAANRPKDFEAIAELEAILEKLGEEG